MCAGEKQEELSDVSSREGGRGRKGGGWGFK